MGVSARILVAGISTVSLQVAIYLKSAIEDGTLGHATVITMRRLLIGYVVGIVGGLPLGLLTARWNLFRDTIGTTALGLQTLPSVCWVRSRCFGSVKPKPPCCLS